MAFLSISKLNLFALTLLCSSYSGCLAQGNPVQNALSCFNNKFIYARCEEPYRLDQSGCINVPALAMNSFCHGPCLTETQLVLDCVDNIFSNFLFNNKATIPDIRGAINMGCTYNNREGGIFDFGGLLQGVEFGGTERSKSSVMFYMPFMIIGFFYVILY